MTHGVMARALPVKPKVDPVDFTIPVDPYECSESFGAGSKRSRFETAGVMQGCKVMTGRLNDRVQRGVQNPWRRAGR